MYKRRKFLINDILYNIMVPHAFNDIANAWVAVHIMDYSARPKLHSLLMNKCRKLYVCKSMSMLKRTLKDENMNMYVIKDRLAYNTGIFQVLIYCFLNGKVETYWYSRLTCGHRPHLTITNECGEPFECIVFFFCKSSVLL